MLKIRSHYSAGSNSLAMFGMILSPRTDTIGEGNSSKQAVRTLTWRPEFVYEPHSSFILFRIAHGFRLTHKNQLIDQIHSEHPTMRLHRGGKARCLVTRMPCRTTTLNF